MRYPLDNFSISQGFSAGHPALDLATPEGRPVKAPEDGTVTQINENVDPDAGGYFGGKYIILMGVSGLRHYMGHHKAVHVRTGQKVSEGQHIADVGSTGFGIPRLGISAPSGPHVHHEVIRNGVQIDFKALMKSNVGGSMAGEAHDKEVAALKQELAQSKDYGAKAATIAEDRLEEIKGLRARVAELEAHSAKVTKIAEDRLGDIGKYQARIAELEKTNPEPEAVELGNLIKSLANKGK